MMETIPSSIWNRKIFRNNTSSYEYKCVNADNVSTEASHGSFSDHTRKLQKLGNFSDERD